MADWVLLFLFVVFVLCLQNMQKTYVKISFLLFCLGFTFILKLACNVELKFYDILPNWHYSFYGENLHALVYGVLGYVLGLWMLALAVCEEAAQWVFKVILHRGDRVFEWMDIIRNCSGVAVGYFLKKRICNAQKPTKPPK